MSSETQTGTPLTRELFFSLTKEQQEALLRVDETREQLETLERNYRGNPSATQQPIYSLMQWSGLAEQEIMAECYPHRRAKLIKEMGDYIRQAVDLGLAYLAVIQRLAMVTEVEPYVKHALAK